MIGRIIEIATEGVHLSAERGFMVVATQDEELGRIALDDIGALVVHAYAASYTTTLTARLAERGVPTVLCSNDHSPVALIWPMQGHFDQGNRMQAQADAARPLRKRLWQILVRAKLRAQGEALEFFGDRGGGLRDLAARVKTGDPENIEAQGARRYWRQMLGPDFRRDRSANGSNRLLNYGYMVLRAAVSRSIVAAGLHPSLSIFHQSRGSALRLADDLMEPFRPQVDILVRGLMEQDRLDLDSEVKAELARVTTLDLEGPTGASPVQTCMDRLATSLAQVYLGERRDLELPGPLFILRAID